MDSPLSSTVANILMEDLEMPLCGPKNWLRYVDDVFAIWPHGDHLLETFHRHLNRQNPSIQFTMDVEERNYSPDLCVPEKDTH